MTACAAKSECSRSSLCSLSPGAAGGGDGGGGEQLVGSRLHLRLPLVAKWIPDYQEQAGVSSRTGPLARAAASSSS